MRHNLRQAALLVGILSMFGFTLTAPGIAGLVLTIGMAVDTNVIIFERIIPMICVVAKPRTGPSPKYARMPAVSNVVTCASNTGAIDVLYPSLNAI